jgi:hypothetical protein
MNLPVAGLIVMMNDIQAMGEMSHQLARYGCALSTQSSNRIGQVASSSIRWWRGKAELRSGSRGAFVDVMQAVQDRAHQATGRPKPPARACRDGACGGASSQRPPPAAPVPLRKERSGRHLEHGPPQTSPLVGECAPG